MKVLVKGPGEIGGGSFPGGGDLGGTVARDKGFVIYHKTWEDPGAGTMDWGDGDSRLDGGRVEEERQRGWFWRWW